MLLWFHKSIFSYDFFGFIFFLNINVDHFMCSLLSYYVIHIISFWLQVVDILSFYFHSKSASSIAIELQLLDNAGFLPTSVAQVLFKVRTIFGWYRKNSWINSFAKSKNDMAKRRFVPVFPSHCESALSIRPRRPHNCILKSSTITSIIKRNSLNLSLFSKYWPLELLGPTWTIFKSH